MGILQSLLDVTEVIVGIVVTWFGHRQIQKKRQRDALLADRKDYDHHIKTTLGKSFKREVRTRVQAPTKERATDDGNEARDPGPD